jgi:hypothetical protein
VPVKSAPEFNLEADFPSLVTHLAVVCAATYPLSQCIRS